MFVTKLIAVFIAMSGRTPFSEIGLNGRWPWIRWSRYRTRKPAAENMSSARVYCSAVMSRSASIRSAR